MLSTVKEEVLMFQELDFFPRFFFVARSKGITDIQLG